MKYTLLYIFIFLTTCCWAQSFEQYIVAEDAYGISSNFNNTDPKVSIFPNPTSDFISIEDKAGVVHQITFYNVLGKEVISYNSTVDKKFDIMNFQKGIYLLQLKDQEGQILQTIRLKKI